MILKKESLNMNMNILFHLNLIQNIAIYLTVDYNFCCMKIRLYNLVKQNNYLLLVLFQYNGWVLSTKPNHALGLVLQEQYIKPSNSKFRLEVTVLNTTMESKSLPRGACVAYLLMKWLLYDLFIALNKSY